MSYRTGSLASALLVLVTAGHASAQQTPNASSPPRTQLFKSDTIDTGMVALAPDQRWLAVPVQETPGVSSLWVQPVNGGAMRRLTSSGSYDWMPQWSPDGQRLFFYSNRAARGNSRDSYIMVLPFDARTGAVSGESRQVSAEGALWWRVSPDGKQIAYVDQKDRRVLKLIPATGGAARVVAKLSGTAAVTTWSTDGASLYVVVNVSNQRQLYRIPLAGGEPVEVARDLPSGMLLLGPDAATMLVTENATPRGRTMRLVRRDGTVMKSFTVSANTRPVQFVDQGRSVIAVEPAIDAPTRILSIADGSHRDITTPKDYYDWVVGFTADGKAVDTWTEHNGEIVLARVPVAGGPPRVLHRETAEWGAEGANSRYVFVASKRQGAKLRTLVAGDLNSDARHTITTSADPRLFPIGPGGTWGVQEELLYMERNGDRIDIKVWSAPSHARTIRSLTAAVLERSVVGVHGDKVVWQQVRGDSTDLYIAERNGPSRRLLTYPAMLEHRNELAFSHDGRLLALHVSNRPAGNDDLMAIVDVTGQTPARIIKPDLTYWYWPRWLPDNSGVAVIGGGIGSEADVVLIPAREGTEVNLTRSDPSSKWGFELSPDGRYIAYPREIWKGSAAWKFDLGDMASAAR